LHAPNAQRQALRACFPQSCFIMLRNQSQLL
jgi:hypothetical protein